MGCGCGGRASAAAAAQPSILGYMYQPPKVNGVLPAVEGPYSTILEARARQRHYGGGTITTLRKQPATA